MSEPILEKLATPPSKNKSSLYVWCDYIELRCFTHRDKRFSRDALAESIHEMGALAPEDDEDDTEDGETDDGRGEDDEAPDEDKVVREVLPHEKNEARIVGYFKQLRWRAATFGDAWPFTLDAACNEIKLKKLLTSQQIMYLQLLLSSSLRYVPKKRSKDLTKKFEALSVEIFRKLMPAKAEVHAFGAANSTRFKGHLYNRLLTLANEIRGTLLLKKRHFSVRDAGDGGLDIVAWHPMGDERKNIPVALAQCGCTLNDWGTKMLEASPARLSSKLVTQHPWATYYFMPLDLSMEDDGIMDWQHYSKFSDVVVLDRLRLIRLANDLEIPSTGWSATMEVAEASAIAIA